MNVIPCSGQSNMRLMVPVLQVLYPDYQFINGAVGATSISQWQKGTPLFEDLVSQTLLAIADGHTVPAMFVSQGEADTGTLDAAQAWPSRFLDFCNNFKVDIGLAGPPGVCIPIVYAQLGANPDPGRPHWDLVKQSQANLQERLGLHLVVLDDIAYGDTPPHYASYEKPAKRFMAVYLKTNLRNP